jgi:hypothetical protein
MNLNGCNWPHPNEDAASSAAFFIVRCGRRLAAQAAKPGVADNPRLDVAAHQIAVGSNKTLKRLIGPPVGD